MTNLVDIMTGLAELLDGAGIGDFSPTAAYAAGDTAIALKNMPADPDRAIVITAYLVDAQPAMHLDQVNVQIRTRGAPDDTTDVDVLADQVYAFCQGLTYVQLGGVTVNQMILKSSIPMGIDQNNRWERSDNYTLDVDVPATANRPQ